MIEHLVAAVAQRYSLPSLRYDSSVDQGYLSQNHILINQGQRDQSQRYFLKQYRFTDAGDNAREKVSTIHRAKFHFAGEGIPAILPLPAQGGETFFAWRDRFFALFPYVEGIKSDRGAMSRRALESAGSMLGRIHRAGYGVLDIAQPSGKAAFDAQPFWEKTARMLAIIEEKERLSEFDELAQKSLLLKRRLAEQSLPIFKELGLLDDHLVHGDYQNDNFFVDADERVSHVFDWELTKVTAREVALLRSVLFMCLQKGNDFMPVLTEDAFRQAEIYLAAYNQVYPVDTVQLAAAVENRYLGNIYSTWVEEEHYLMGNDRVDLFLPGAVAFLEYLAQERESFTQRLCGLL